MPVSKHGANVITGQALFEGQSGNGELMKAVESTFAGYPDVAFPIFEQAEHDIA
jgi:hypothetical protein